MLALLGGSKLMFGLAGIGGNATWMVLQRVFELILRFFLNAWMIRYLGPAQFGIYSYALSYVALFANVATLGLDQVVVRDLARGVRPAGQILATAFALRTVAGVAMFALVALLALATESDPTSRLAIVVAAGQLLFNPANVVELWFQSEVRSRVVVWARSFVTLLFGLGQAYCIWARLSLIAFLILLLLQAALTAVAMYVCLRVAGPRGGVWTASRDLGREMMLDGWPLLVAGLSISIYMRIDQVMLGWMAGEVSVGTYSAAVKVSEVWYFVPMAIVTSAFSTLVQLKASAALDRFDRSIQALYDGLALYSYLIIVPTVIASEAIIRILFSDAYLPSAAVLRVHVLSLVFVSLSVVNSRWMVAEGRAVYTMWMTLTGAAANVALNLLWIPAHAEMGAAWATVVSYAVAAYVSCLFFPGMRRMFWALSRALIVPFRMGALVRELRHGLKPALP